MGKRIRNTLNHRPSRIRRKLIVLGTEGKNKTETYYFTQLEKKQNKYHFIFTSNNNTDPNGIISSVYKEAKNQELNYKGGDIAAALFDLDLDSFKIENIDNIKRLADKKKVDLYTSNPCFELWLLLHFKCTTKPYNSNSEVIDELKKYLPDYKKNDFDFKILEELMSTAIDNAKQMQLIVSENNNSKESMVDNPNTDVYLLVEKLITNK